MRTYEQLLGLIARVAAMLGIAIVLALLYFGRDILVPVTLALILSLLITPFIRMLRRVGFGHAASVAVAVILTGAILFLICAGIGLQLLRIGESLPQYADTIREKLAIINQMTLGRLGNLTQQADAFLSSFNNGTATLGTNGTAVVAGSSLRQPVTVAIQAPTMHPSEWVLHGLSIVWHPIESAGIVLVVLVFVLFEHEALRDRFIRLAGRDDLRGATIAVNDAGERLSRFFISQVMVNVAVGTVVGVVLLLLGISEAFLWGALAAILRFVPYIGVWIAAACATILAAAMSSGFGLPVATLGAFFIIEMFFAQIVEPKLYGHTTGLSPLSVVVSAIFWSWLWGPVGLVLSTPLTLCLVVSGRYFRAFNMFEILLGELPALTLPQNFYQRALSGDVQEMLAAARAWLRKRSFASYCDAVLIPALHLARKDMDADSIGEREQEKVSSSIVAVIVAIETNPRWWRYYARPSVLHGITAGQQLRTQREMASSRVGAATALSGATVLCIGAGGKGDELAAEILVRILRKQDIAGHHILPDGIERYVDSRDASQDIALCCVVSITPVLEHDIILSLLAKIKQHVPSAKRLGLLVPSPFEEMALREYAFSDECQVIESIEATVQVCLTELHAYDPE